MAFDCGQQLLAQVVWFPICWAGLLCRVDLQGAQDMGRQTKQAPSDSQDSPILLPSFLAFFFLFLEQKYYIFFKMMWIQSFHPLL